MKKHIDEVKGNESFNIIGPEGWSVLVIDGEEEEVCTAEYNWKFREPVEYLNVVRSYTCAWDIVHTLIERGYVNYDEEVAEYYITSRYNSRDIIKQIKHIAEFVEEL
jgi:hypothetical protein